MQETLTHIGDLTPDPRNPRKHGQRNIGTIVKSLEEVGAGRSIVIDEDNVILAGNGLIEAAGIAGIERLRVVEADGNEIIAVRRSGLTDKQKKRFAVLDNRAGELAEWNPAVMGELAAEMNLTDLFNADEMSRIFDTFAVPDFEPVGIDEQGRLDEKKQCTCPECGHTFTP